MLVRVSVVSDSFFNWICFLIGSNWKQFTLHRFVLIPVRTSVNFKLHLAFCLVRVIISSFKVV